MLRVAPMVALLFLIGCDPPLASDAGTDGGADAGLDAGSTRRDAGLVAEIGWPEMGSPSAASGAGSFRFGAASAASQIEDQNTDVDWYVWSSAPPEGLGEGTDPIGDAVRGFSLAQDDVDVVEEMALDSYRFSVEWARVEPQRDQVSEEALAHYGALIDTLVARSIRPMITLHHFSNPLWVDDPRRVADADPCAEGPTDEWLCGWQHPEGGPLIIEELAEHACTLATRYGDRVDEWATFNEPVNYLFASYGAGRQFPPGRQLILEDFPAFMQVVHNVLAAHAAMKAELERCDTVDADGDGDAASVGLTLSVVDWTPARQGRRSTQIEDVEAAQRVRYVYHQLVTDALTTGTFDRDVDGSGEEAHPEWADSLEWLGVQYYSRLGVTAQPAIIAPLRATPCFPPFLGVGSACIPAEDPTHFVPEMRYEYYAPGLFDILMEYGERYPSLPLMVTEAGIATEVGARRAENVVRTLEQIHFARREGVDVRGYYHWSLTDNFEWAEGYGPRFGLYHVERSGDYARTPTLGATVLGDIAEARALTLEQRMVYGGDGPMTPEE